MKRRVWVEGNLSEKALSRLERVSNVVRSRNIDDAAGAAAAVLSSTLPADDSFIERAGPSLLAIARPGIGVDNIDLKAASRQGVLVINTPDAPSESTAEHTVALLLALAKRVVRGHFSLTTSPLPKSALLGTELKGLLLGIVGYGRIGSRVAEICGNGLRMEVLVYDPLLPASALRPPARRAATLEELLRTADVVTLHAPLAEETRNLIGRAELEMMKREAYLINASRGPVVDEPALTSALRDGRIAGAALDVFATEPPSADNPLFALDNVVVTPHVASFTEAGVEAMGSGVVEQLEAVFRGERPVHLVNPAAWPGRLEGARRRSTNQ